MSRKMSSAWYFSVWTKSTSGWYINFDNILKFAISWQLNVNLSFRLNCRFWKLFKCVYLLLFYLFSYLFNNYKTNIHSLSLLSGQRQYVSNFISIIKYLAMHLYIISNNVCFNANRFLPDCHRIFISLTFTLYIYITLNYSSSFSILSLYIYMIRIIV